MWDTTSRTFELLGMLQRNGFVGSDKLASDLGVTTRTVRRDVARLRDLGYPVDTRIGVDGGYSLEPGAVLPPIFLSTKEAIACALALREWKEGSDPNLTASSLGKLLASLPSQVRWIIEAVAKVTTDVPIDGLEPIDPSVIDIGILGELAKSCLLERRVGFSYTQRSGEVKDRRVDPVALVNTVRRWYLVAFDIDADDWRTYRVDHISAVAVTQTPVRSRSFPGPSVSEWVTRQLSVGWQQVTATVRVHASVNVVERWVAPAWGTVEQESDHTSIVRAGAESYESIARWLLLLQAEVDVLEPAGLRVAFGAVAEQAARAAEPRQASGSAAVRPTHSANEGAGRTPSDRR